MKSIFGPAIAFCNRLRYRIRLAIMGFLALLVVAILTFQIYTQMRSVIDFSQQEIKGTAYIQTLYGLSDQLQKLRIQRINYNSADNMARDNLLNLVNSVDGAVQKVQQQDDKYQLDLKATADWQALKSKWTSAKGSLFINQSQDNFSKLSDLINDINNLIVIVADNSNLTLDPDIDTYYLMDTYATKLPAINESASIIRILGSGLIKQANLSMADVDRIKILKTLIEYDKAPKLEKNLSKAISFNPGLAAKFSQLTQALTKETKTIVAVTNEVLEKRSALSAEAYANKFEELANLNTQYYTALNNSLNELIAKRIENSYRTLYIDLTISIVGLLLLGYLFVGMYFSIMRSIESLVSGADRLAKGDLSAEFHLTTHDELSQVESSFKIMRNNMSALITETREAASSAMQGDLSHLVTLSDKEGVSLELGQAINQMLSTSQAIISDTLHVLNALSHGDLTGHIDNEYEGSFGQLKNYTNNTVSSLQKLITEIAQATVTINSAAKEIAFGNADLSRRTEQQAAALEETSASIEELSATVKQNSDNAKRANSLSQDASSVAVKGGDVVKQVIHTMASINDSSRKIVDIISVIDGIAFQTNILALNAAVEAARAGEQGRGFAVVATEVRNLAQRSASAAKEIKTLITDSVEKVENGSKLVDHAGQTMEEIVKAVKEVSTIISEITTASIEQSSGIEQVNQAIYQMDEVTQQNAALVEEAAAAAESLEVQAQHVNERIKVFKLSHIAMQKADDEQAGKNFGKAKKDTKKIAPRSKDEDDMNWKEF